MANAAKETAPLPQVKTPSNPVGEKEKAALGQEFDPNKTYVFELAARNMERTHPIFNLRTKRVEPHKPFKPSQNVVLSSQIVWDKARINIRYYDGCESIFVSEQPKEKDVVDQLIQQTKKRNFLLGRMNVKGYDRMLLLYLSICSWNAESPFRTDTANAIFVNLNPDKKALHVASKMDDIEKALKYAREATETKMLIHAAYLGIPVTDWDSGNELTPKQIRASYREYAANNANEFIKSYGDTSLEVKYYIDKALKEGVINNKMNQNKAAWGNSNSPICNISGLTSHEAIADAIFNHSKTEDGAEFVIQLKAIYTNVEAEA